ncbi:hypothetical protein L915_02364 [Phytophthora nicotianae]|uniref:HAT C-terminal dimerisation domain-containing protein n=2 Tax=Phytophthora nicotianae TaxID=4792 RepID=W2HJG3_PHYNI|nr:hypothetical protein L915_02364 [Phytophthora nicotianae]ETM54290.1 hypothetical protein L914_02356 [Phytophthora nicotianae]
MLQDEETSMADNRQLFNSLLDRYSDLDTHLNPSSKIVQSPNFENAAIKVANGAPLRAAEAKPVAKFKRKRDRAPDFAMTILLEGSAARRTGQSSVVYKLAADEGSATSNACERLFAQTGLILTPQRGRLANANFEALTFLRANLGM